MQLAGLAVLDVRRRVGRDPLMQHRFVVETRQARNRWDQVDLQPIQLDRPQMSKLGQAREKSTTGLAVVVRTGRPIEVRPHKLEPSTHRHDTATL